MDDNMQATLSRDKIIEKPRWRQVRITERLEIPLPFSVSELVEPSPRKVLVLLHKMLEQEFVWAGWENQNPNGYFKRVELEHFGQEDVDQVVNLKYFINTRSSGYLDGTKKQIMADAFTAHLRIIFEEFYGNSVLKSCMEFNEANSLYTVSFKFNSSASLDSSHHKGYQCQTWVHASMKKINQFWQIQIPEVDISVGFMSFKKLFLDDVLAHTSDYFRRQENSNEFLVNFIAYHEMLGLKREFKHQLPLYKRRGFTFSVDKAKDAGAHADMAITKEVPHAAKLKQQPVYNPMNEQRKRDHISPLSQISPSKETDNSSLESSSTLQKRFKL